jgi:twitching motility protein PilT
MTSASRQAGELLVERKVLSRDTLEEVLDREATTGVPMSKILVSEGLVGERDLVAVVADQLQMPFWDPDTQTIAPIVAGMLPPELAWRLTAMAVAIADSHLLVALADPTNRDTVAEISQATGWQIRPMLAARSDLRQGLANTYGEPPVRATDVVGEIPPPSELHLNVLLTEMVALGASDLHLSSGRAPSVRVDGAIRELEGYAPLNGSDLRQLIYGVLTQRQREKFEADRELDASHAVPNVGRFRLNVFLQRDSVGAVLRAIPFEVVPLARLGVPQVLEEFANLPRGLVLVTGPTGSGKSTTLASIIDIINSQRELHIMTVEDPIEFLHNHKRCVVNQREVGEDTTSFASALKHVLRQDPDVILVGEMRDLETISTALTAAETGHLVFGTLHTQDAPQSVDRVIDVFPAHQQQQIRVQLSSALQAVVTQQLLPRHNSKGRAVACEVLVATSAVRNLIREGKTHQIYSVMQAGGKYGMQTMDQSLANLVRSGSVALEVALERCNSEQDFRRLVQAAN